MITWAGVHAGDTVRGADGRAWSVLERYVGPRWVIGGGFGRFVMDAGSGPISIMRKLDEPCPLIARADHAEDARAAGVLIEAGLNLTLLGEGPMTEPDPFTPPAAVVKRGDAPTGKWNWYKLPHPITGEADRLWPRVSTIANTLEDEYGLTEWKLRMVAKGVAVSPDLIAKAAAADPAVDKADFAAVVKSAMERAEAGAGANFGTAMHAFAERLDNGETIAAMRVPAPLIPDVQAYAAALKAAKLRVLPELSERVVVNADLEYAGRWDRVVEDQAGDLYVLDLKTGKDVIDKGQLKTSIQQAFYANATHLCIRDFTAYEPMPPVSRLKAFILHLPIGAGQGAVYGLDIAEGWRDANLALTVRARRSAANKGRMWAYSPGTPADAVKVRIGRAVALDELGAAVADAQRINGAWTPELEAYALARYDLIRVRDASRTEDLAALWAELEPAGRWTTALYDAATHRAVQLKGT